jgi:hypothetical protein
MGIQGTSLPATRAASTLEVGGVMASLKYGADNTSPVSPSMPREASRCTAISAPWLWASRKSFCPAAALRTRSQ